MFLSDRIGFLLERLTKETKRSSESSTTSCDAEERSPSLKVLQARNSHSYSSITYKTYRLFDRSHTYNKKMAVRTGKHGKRMEKLMKEYKICDKILITTLCFLAQVTRAYDSNGAFERIAICILPTFLENGPLFGLTV